LSSDESIVIVKVEREETMKMENDVSSLEDFVKKRKRKKKKMRLSKTPAHSNNTRAVSVSNRRIRHSSFAHLQQLMQYLQYNPSPYPISSIASGTCPPSYGYPKPSYGYPTPSPFFVPPMPAVHQQTHYHHPYQYNPAPPAPNYVHPQHIHYQNPHSVAAIDQLIPRRLTLAEDTTEESESEEEVEYEYV